MPSHYGSGKPESGASNITLIHMLGGGVIPSERASDGSGARNRSERYGMSERARGRASSRASGLIPMS